MDRKRGKPSRNLQPGMDISPYPKILVLKTEMIDAQLGDVHLQTNQLRLDLYSSIVLSFIRDSGVFTKLLAGFRVV